MSADIASLFASSLNLRFTQPSDLNDPFEFRPFVDFDATASELEKEIDARVAEEFGTVDAVIAVIEDKQKTDPNYPKLSVPIHIFRELVAANPRLGEQLMAEVGRHKAELMESYRKAAVWEVQWEKFQTALGQTMGILSLTE